MTDKIIPQIKGKAQSENSVNVPRESDQEQIQDVIQELNLSKKKPVKATEERQAKFAIMAGENKTQFCATSEEEIVNKLNQRHAVVHTSEFHILTEKPHPFILGAMDFTLESKQSFINTYENEIIKFSDGITRNAAQIWLKSPNRRTFLDGIVFDPAVKGHKETAYNIWKGFSVEPKAGSCALFKAHIRDIICAGNAYYYNYVWKWLTKLIQHPEEIATGLVLMGSQGTGKGKFAKTIGKLFGLHFVHLDNLERLLGNFNFHLKNAVLVFGDEAIWGGNRRDIGKLKAMVTEEFAMIEPKGKDSIAVKNFRHFILASNEDWPIHLDRDDRRFLVLEVSDSRKEDFAYFKAIDAELASGGLEALLYELQNEDISAFNPRELPQNAEAFKIKIQSAPTIEQYIYKALNEGCFDIGNASPCGTWQTNIPCESLFNDYVCWCEAQRMPNMSQEKVGMALRRLIPSVTKVRRRLEGDRRQAQYSFPSLAASKEAFQKSFKVGSEIWE